MFWSLDIWVFGDCVRCVCADLAIGIGLNNDDDDDDDAMMQIMFR